MSDVPMRVECTECHFTKIVHPDDDGLPSDIVIEHGRTTGHRLTVGRVDEDHPRVDS